MTSPYYLTPDGVAMRFKKRKARFTFSEVHILLDEVRKNRHVVVGKFNCGVPSEVKKRTWAEITARVNEIGECDREVIEVIKKWSDLKCDTKRKVAAMRSGVVPYRGSPRQTCELTPTENIVHQILELDRKHGQSGAGPNGTIPSLDSGPVEEDDDEDMEMLGSMGAQQLLQGSLDNDHNLPDSDDDHPNALRTLSSSLATPTPQASAAGPPEEAGSSPADASVNQPSAMPPQHTWPSAAQPSDSLAQNALLSVQEQHTTNALLETVSRSLELLAESVQQLAETQQEFARESLQLQRDTVQVLRDFASGALALMHDKLNGRPAV
ncbi:nuclear apoptosis-inducing factor 1 [Denticeps clupeoides]|nr:nuclear apoptosis-inducing factor 1-like [Denticeps clupeoides]